MGVCVWSAASSVSLWSCDASGNGHHSLGARDGSVIHCYGHTLTHSGPAAQEEVPVPALPGLEMGSRQCSGLDGLDDGLPVEAVNSMLAANGAAEPRSAQLQQSLGDGFLESLLDP
eukprot:2926290-Rhodomonas_salina.1